MDEQQNQERKGKPVHIKTIVKKILIDLYSRDLLPKKATQQVYDLLDLKED